MKIKLIIDFQAKDSLDIIEYFNDYRCYHDLDIEIYGYDIEQSNLINNAYYGLYYANKFGVGLEYAHRILNAYHNEDQDINDLEVLAKNYTEINFNCHDLIDAIMEGDYAEMYKYYQSVYRKEAIDKPCYAFIYDSEKHVLESAQEIIDFMENKKSS